MNTIKAVPTTYRGIMFRSGLEAKWAIMLDMIGIQFKYESRLFKTSDGYYLPDFWLPDLGCWLELKPSTDEGPSEDEYLKAQAVADQDKRPCFIVCGFPKSEQGNNKAILFLPESKPVPFYIQNLLWNIPSYQRLLYSAAALSAESRHGFLSTKTIGEIAMRISVELGITDRYKHNNKSQEAAQTEFSKSSKSLTELKDFIVSCANEIFSGIKCLN